MFLVPSDYSPAWSRAEMWQRFLVLLQALELQQRPELPEPPPHIFIVRESRTQFRQDFHCGGSNLTRVEAACRPDVTPQALTKGGWAGDHWSSPAGTARNACKARGAFQRQDFTRHLFHQDGDLSSSLCFLVAQKKVCFETSIGLVLLL